MVLVMEGWPDTNRLPNHLLDPRYLTNVDKLSNSQTLHLFFSLVQIVLKFLQIIAILSENQFIIVDNRKPDTIFRVSIVVVFVS